MRTQHCVCGPGRDLGSASNAIGRTVPPRHGQSSLPACHCQGKGTWKQAHMLINKSTIEKWLVTNLSSHSSTHPDLGNLTLHLPCRPPACLVSSAPSTAGRNDFSSQATGGKISFTLRTGCNKSPLLTTSCAFQFSITARQNRLQRRPTLLTASTRSTLHKQRLVGPVHTRFL